MKIVILCDYFDEHEINRASFRIRYLTALHIAKKGHDVAFIYPSKSFNLINKSYENPKEKTRMKIIGTPGLFPMKFRTGGFGFIDGLFKTLFVLTHSVDVIQVGSGHRPSNFLPSMVCKYLKRSITVDECWEWLGEGGYADSRRGFFGRVISLYDKYLEIKLRSLFDNIIVISTELKKRFKIGRKVTVLLGGIENQALHPYALDEARAMVGISKDIFLVGMSNVIRGDHKENKICFEACRKICRRYPKTRLFLSGTDKRYIEEIADKFELKEQIIFKGYIDFEEYNKHLSSCNVFVLPYSNTLINRCRWPNKIGDFICLERPIITNPTGDVKELFTKYKLGILCSENSEAFYNSLQNVIKREYEDKFDAEEASFVANNLLTFSGRIDRMLEIFTGLLKCKNDKITN